MTIALMREWRARRGDMEAKEKVGKRFTSMKSSID
jgi:hypothetical protein